MPGLPMLCGGPMRGGCMPAHAHQISVHSPFSHAISNTYQWTRSLAAVYLQDHSAM